MTFSRYEQKALTIVPKATSLLSAIALVTFLRCIIAQRRENLKKMYHRLVFGMAIVDLTRSTSSVIGTWFVPSQNENEIYWGIGTNTTCTIQGFINQIGLAVPLYGTAICIYAYLTIRNDFQSEIIAPVEKWLHGVSISLATILAIALTASDSATPSGSWCWLPPISLEVNIWGSFVTLLSAGLIFTSLLIGIIMIVFILITEDKKRKERKEWRGKMKFMETARSIKAQHLTNQVILHLLALIICNLFIAIIPMSGSLDCFPGLFIGNILITLSGFFNVMIYTKILNASKPPPVSDISPSFSIRQLSANDLPIVTHGFNPCTKISSTFGNMFILNDQKHNVEDFAVFTGDSEDEIDPFEKEQLPDQPCDKITDVESLVDCNVSKNELLANDNRFIGDLI